MKIVARLGFWKAAFVILIISACSPHKREMVPNKKTSAAEDTSPNWSLDLIKGGCPDVCQAYSIWIKSTGDYNYHGVYNVRYKGDRSGKLHDSVMVSLKEKMNAIDWDNLKASYGEKEQTQRKELHYNGPGMNKHIIYHRLEPPEIRSLEQYIDAITQKDDF